MTVSSFDRPGGESFYRLHPAVKRRVLAIGDVRRGTSPLEAARRAVAMRRLALEVRPDVAVGFMHSSYITLGVALVGTGIPLVASEHASYDHYRTRPVQALLLRLTPYLADVITVISPAIRQGFPASLRQRMETIPNPVQASRHGFADTSAKQEAAKTLLAVGRLDEEKDHRTLIAAFGRIAADFPDWRLRIVGDGKLRQKLKAQVRCLDLESRVALPGSTLRIEEEYLSAQLFVMPSRYESFGLTTAEALGHGLPVIGFADCPGTNDMVQHGVNGLLVSGPNREQALAEGLATLMRCPGLRQRFAKAAAVSIQPFAPETVTDIFEALLRRLAEPGTAAAGK